MSNRAAVVLVFSLTLAVARVLGLHFHLPDTDAAAGFPAGQPAAFETPHHHAEHAASAQPQADDDDVDVDEPGIAVSKPALPDMPWLLISIACALLLLPALRRAPVASPPFRPPRNPSPRFLLPPSQAPPGAA